jgi:hypothetical protein
MTDQTPRQPPLQPEQQPSGHPAQANPATQPMSAAANPAPAIPPSPPKTNAWHQATSTRGGRWAIGIAAVVLVVLMFLSIGVAGFLVLRNHDRFAMMGQRTDGSSRGQFGQGNGRGPGGSYGNPGQPGMPGAPGMRGGRELGGLGGVLGGTALHGDVTATVNGVTQPLVFQRGQVTAVSATSITLKSSDGFVGTYARTTSTSSTTVAPVTGGQAFVLARASDKVAITIRAM